MKDRSKRPVWILFGILSLPCLGLIGVGAFFGLKYYDYGPASSELEKAVADYRASGMPWEAKQVVPSKPAPEVNAAEELKEAIANFDEVRFKKELKALQSDLDTSNFASAIQKLGRYQRALSQSLAASKKPRLDFERDWDMGANLPFSENGPIRYLVRALTARAELNAARGKDDDAIKDLQVADSLARKMGQESGLVSMLLSISSARVVSDAAVRCATYMEARPQSLEMMVKLLDDSFTWDLEFSLRGEAYMAISTIRNLRYFKHLIEKGEEKSEQESLDPSQLVRSGVPEDTISRAYLARVLQYWVAAKATMDRHRDDPPKMWKALETMTNEWEERKGLSYLLNAIMTPVTSQVGISIQRTIAERRAARELILALSHRTQSGKFPQSVTSIDPFTSKPLQVKPLAKGIKIYSVGSDLMDNGGINQADLPAGADKSKGWDVSVEFPPPKRRP